MLLSLIVYYLQYWFNIYTNDQPLHDGTRNFVYADDLCVTSQYPSFTEVEHTIEEALDELIIYYRSNSLRANPDKTQVASFHLKNREAKRTLEVKWNNTDMENTPRCHLGQNPELQTAHTQHKDEGGHPKQPPEEVIKLQMGLQHEHY